MKKYLCRTFGCVFGIMFFAVQNMVFAQATISENTYINFLDTKSVSIIKTKYIEIEGTTHKLGESQTISFENSDDGRKSLVKSISDPFLSAVTTVWDNSAASKEETSTEKLLSETETVAINETMHIDLLNDKSVAFLKTKTTDIDGVEYQLGEPWAVSFENSAKGRESLAEIIPDPFFSAVMAIWGDTPTVTLPVESQLV